MKSRSQEGHSEHRDEQLTRSERDTADETAEPDGQFPENAHGTLDDHQPGEDPTRANDPNAENASLTTDPDGVRKVAQLRREARESQ